MEIRSFKPVVRHFDKVVSTNNTAWRIYDEDNNCEVTVVVASAQTGGKGRLSRNWYSPVGENLYVSVILRPDIGLDKMHVINAIGALSALDTVKKYTSENSGIVFPNDVYVNGRKICGILSETRLSSGKPEAFVLGAGINVNSCDFPEELRNKATSLKLLENREFAVKDVLNEFVQNVDYYYSCLAGDIYTIYERWREHNILKGKRITVFTNRKSRVDGVLEDSDPADGIMLRTDNGTIINYRYEDIYHVECGAMLQS